MTDMTLEEIYTSLAARHGEGESDRYKAILKFLMTPLQARLAVSLPLPNEELAAQEGISVEQVVDELEELYQKGVIFPRNFETREYFRFSRHSTQLHDASGSLWSKDHLYTAEQRKELFTLWHDWSENEWEPNRMKNRPKPGRPGQRVLPAWKAIKDIEGVLPHESLEAIIDAQDNITVVSCSCRKRFEEVATPCSFSHDMNCMQFGRSGEYAKGRGHGKVLSKQEAMDLIEEMEDHGLVHMWPNVDIMHTNSMCSCCNDCCQLFKPVKQYEVPWSLYLEKSRFEPRNDLDACNGCQDCIDRCQFDALSMTKVEGHKKLKAEVDSEKCVGCAVCVLVCEPESLTMQMVRPPEHIPAMPAAAQ